MKAKKKDFEINGENIKGMFEESKKKRLVFFNSSGDVIISMVLPWALIVAICFWPFFVIGVILTLLTGGSVKVEKN